MRRLCALRSASRAVYEGTVAHRDWTEPCPDAVITERCFRVPVPARALVDRVLGDALEQREQRGEFKTLRRMLRGLLASRGAARRGEGA